MPKSASQKVEIKSWADANAILAELKGVEAEHDRLVARRDGGIAKIKKRYGSDIGDRAAEVKAIQSGLFDFLADHRDEMDDKRSRALPNGVVSLRWGPPKLVTLSRVTFEKVLERARALPSHVRALFLIEEPKLDKKDLQTAIRDGSIDPAQRRKLGVDVIQEEYVYYDHA